MAEWFKAAVLKTVVRLRVPRVRIPLSPQLTILLKGGLILECASAWKKEDKISKQLIMASVIPDS